MNTPYTPISDYPSLVVKVYNSKTHSVYWLNRSFLSIKNIINSYTHQKYWRGKVYIVYKLPDYSFVEILLYTDSHVRIILDSPEAETLAGGYMEGWGFVKDE